MSTYNIAIVGDAGVGKTAIVKSLKKADFERRYIATVGCECHPLYINTNDGKILLNIYDFGGKDEYFNNPNVDYHSLLKTMDHVVVVYSRDIPRSYENAVKYWRNIVDKPVTIILNDKDNGIRPEFINNFKETLASVLVGN